MPPLRIYRALDLDYPYALRELAAPPDPLCVRGEPLFVPAVAIVGTRHPSAEAEAYAHDLAFRLARSGVAVWSGGAVGIDAAVHRGALDAGGVTVAVVGTGLDHCYPPEHAALYEEIVLAGGAIVSPFEPAQEARLFTFPQRNGALAALTQATVVVQAALRSGARSTARFARKLGRPLFVVPSAPWDAKSAGNVAELGLGARALIDECVLFKVFEVPWPAPPRTASAPVFRSVSTFSPRPAPSIELASHTQAVFLATSTTPRHLDDLCVETGQPTALVQEALLTLTLEAVLVEGPVGWYKRITI